MSATARAEALQRRGADGLSGADPERWVRGFVGLYLEVEAGLRPGRHLRPLLALDLQPLIGCCGRPGPIPEVTSVRVQCRPGVCEAVVLLGGGPRVSALAIAMRRCERGWQVTELRRPETPPPSEGGELELVPTGGGALSGGPGDPAVDLARPGWDVPAGWGDLGPAGRARAA